MRVVITGLVATYPFGGVFWDYMSYVLGFHRLGHDVLYYEDTGKWAYDLHDRTYVESCAMGATLLDLRLRRLDPELEGRWFVRDSTGSCYGMAETTARQFCLDADIFVHISASCMMREECFAARRVVFIDSDPWYTPATLPTGTEDGGASEEHIAWLRRHQEHLSFGEKVGDRDCRIRMDAVRWRPTRQPVVLDALREHRVAPDLRRRVFTTVASWEPHESGPVVDGVRYSGKGAEFLRFLPLPRTVPVELELALSGPAPVEVLAKAGFRVRDGLEVSLDPWSYVAYLAGSSGEWSVAKNAYVGGRTGWFSCRSATYLALGVPVVVQDTGFSEHIPTGEGLFAFSSVEQAAAGIEAILTDPVRHSEASIDLAREYFAHDRVLGQLLSGSPARTEDAVVP